MGYKGMGSNKGFTLIEILVTGALLAIIGVLILPHFFKAKEISKGTDMHTICMDAVNAKLAEYKSGPAAAEMTLVSGNNSITTGVGQSRAAHGFIHAKMKYNAFVPNICDTNTSQTNPTYGILEWVGSSNQLPPIGGNPCTATSYITLSDNSFSSSNVVPARDQKICGINPYFRLYVKLQEIDMQTKAVSCPASTAPYTRDYDFQKKAHAILVTVTGRTEIPSGTTWLGYTSANADRLTCSGQIIVSPVTNIARYILDSDGVAVYEAAGDMYSTNSAKKRVFQSLDSIVKKQILVSNDNRTVLILRDGGVVYKYTNCSTGTAVDCGVSSTVQTYSLPPSIDYLGMDGASGSVFGYFSDGARYANLVENNTDSNNLSYDITGNIIDLPKGVERGKAAFSSGSQLKSFISDNSCDVNVSGYDCQTVFSSELSNNNTNCDGNGSTNCWVPVPSGSFDLRVIGITP